MHRFARIAHVSWLAVVLATLMMVVTPGSRANAQTSGSGGVFMPVSPVLVGDTSTGVGALGSTPFGTDETRTVPIAGSYGVPATGVSAVVIEMTTSGSTASGAFDVYADNAPDPAVPALSYSSGETDSGFDFVAVGADGGISVTSSTASSNLSVIVEGYFTDGSGTASGGYVSIDEDNLLGTSGSMLNPGQSVVIAVTGGAVPTGSSAVFGEIKTSDPTGTSGGALTVYPSGSGQPAAPTMSWDGSGSTTGATLNLGSTGSITVANTGASATQVKLAVDGYFTAGQSSTQAGYFVTDDPLTSMSVSAGASTDVPVADTSPDIPDAGAISAVVLDIQTGAANSVGQLDVQPCGSPTDAVPAMTYRRVDETALAISQLGGTNGCVTFTNLGSDPVNVTVSVQGVFSSADASPLLGGTVTDANGNPAAGATVNLVAWPTGMSIESTASGGTISTPVIATTTADASGNYSLDPNLSTLGSTYVDSSGLVNLEVDAVVGSDSQTYNFVAALSGSDAATIAPDLAVEGTREATINFNASAGTVAETVGTATPDTAITPAVQYDLTPSTIGTAPQDPIPPHCELWTKYQEYPSRTEKFLNLYTYNGNGQVTESAGSAHSLGVAENISSHGWSQSGHFGLTKQSASGGQNAWGRNKQLTNQVNEEELQQLCFSGSNYTGKHYNYKVVPTTFHAFLTSATDIKPRSWKSCNNYYGGRYWKKSGANQDFSTGFDTPFVGVDAHASFSKDTTIEWFVPSSGENLCGSTSQGYVGSPFAGGAKIGTGCPGDTPSPTDDGDYVTYTTDSDPPC